MELILKLAARSAMDGRFGCWVWLGAGRGGHRSWDRGGDYGNVWWEGRNHYPHRLAWALVFGQLDPDLVLDHRCGVRRCWNPLHLEPVTVAENARRATAKRLRAAA